MQELDRVEMSIPAKKEYARLLRLAAAGIASRMNFTVDGLEDLKMGLEEAYLMALSDKNNDRFNVTFLIFAEHLEIIVNGLGTAEALSEEITQMFGFSILDSVMDHVEWIDTGDAKDLHMIKKPA